MPRATNNVASRARRKKVLKQAKGFRGAQSKLFRTAVERLHRAWQYAYRDRKVKKRDFRGLWITRIGIATTQHGLSYSRFMHGLKKANVELNRKVLADLALNSPATFEKLVELAKKG